MAEADLTPFPLSLSFVFLVFILGGGHFSERVVFWAFYGAYWVMACLVSAGETRSSEQHMSSCVCYGAGCV